MHTCMYVYLHAHVMRSVCVYYLTLAAVISIVCFMCKTLRTVAPPSAQQNHHTDSTV